MIECVVNVSEGRDPDVIGRIASAGGADLLDVHSDPHHNRSVFTLVGEDAPRAVTRTAVDAIDLRTHTGVHPRIGAVDVVPFTPLGDSTMEDALHARDRFGRWAAGIGLPCFVYGPERSLPEVRRGAFDRLQPTFGPSVPHPGAGAVAIGARRPLIAWNLWVTGDDPTAARSVAAAVRGPHLRALGLRVGDRVQVSMNLIAPDVIGPAEAHDLVAAHIDVEGAELVGLLPEAVLHRIPRSRWAELDVDGSRTIEARLGSRRA